MKKNKKVSLLLTAVSALYFGCSNNSSNKTATVTDSSTVTQAKLPDSNNFKQTINNKPVDLYLLKNKNNVTVAITNYGGKLVSLLVPDSTGKLIDVILGHDSLKNYIKVKDNFFGTIVGRYGNRIAKGKFTLDGKSYQLDVNDGVNTLHGGLNGLNKQVFDAKQINGQQLELSYLSKDGESHYPGNLSVKVTYTLTDDNALKIEYTATTDKATIINLTNHAYFNLNGAGNKTITDNLLKINADYFLPVDSTLIPTGKLQAVKGTPFDFTSFKAIGQDIGKTDEQLKNGKGYDHNFVLNKHDLTQSVATVKSTITGISVDVYTTEPGIQFYSGNFLSKADIDGKGGAAYPHRSALCLETQHFPDSPNEPSFPSTVLRPGQTYHTITIYKFSNK